MRAVSWFDSPATRRLVIRRYIPILAVLNLTWELGQLPLYTIWHEASAATIAFAVVHCTLGDIVIGTAALLLALTATRSGAPAAWRYLTVALIATISATGYTVFSEWLNTGVRHAWAYSDLMPVLPIVGTGLSPLLQWLLIPSLTLALSLRNRNKLS